jgi:Tfp pilus assembly protein PilF
VSGLVLFLGISVLLIFKEVSSFKFITLDDYTYIVNNLFIQKGLSLEGIKWAFSGSISMYIPLTFISYMFDWQIYNGYSGGFHFTNLVLHMFNSILLFTVLKKYTKTLLPSVFVAFLFAFHPIHVESVAWASERKDVLSTFFFLISIFFYHRQIKKPNTLNSILVSLSYLLGLLSKPMLVTFPFVLLLLDYWPLNRFCLNVPSMKQRHQLKFHILRFIELLREKTSLFLLSITFSLFILMAQRSHGGLASFQVIPLNIRIENAILSYAMYLKKLFWPIDLAVFYPHPMDTISNTALGISVLLLLGITVWIIKVGKKYPYLPVGWFWYLGTMIPVTGISQSGMQAMADRFAYIPFIGLYIILCWGTFSLINRLSPKYNYYAYIGLIIITISVLMALTRSQLDLWRDSETLYAHTLKVTQNNYIMHYAMGDIFAKKANLQEAKNQFHKAVQIEPRFINAIFSIGKINQIEGKLKDALLMYYQVIEQRPNYYPVHKQLGYLWLQLGNLDKAIFYLQNAVSINPENAKLHNDLASVLLNEQNIEKAIFQFKKAIELKPKKQEYQKNYKKALKLSLSGK